MSKICFQIPIPTFIESIVVYFLLRHRKKHYGFAFRCIKLAKSECADIKHRYAIIDPEDYEKVAVDDWQLYENHNSKYYAVRILDSKIVFMHRQIMGNPVGKVIDHRNREGLDNRKSNLRLATRSQNNCNRGRLKNGSSKYRGVSRSKKRRKWRAGINYNGIYKHLGFFENEEDAARAYDEAAKIYHGEFATLNFPPSRRENDPGTHPSSAKTDYGGQAGPGVNRFYYFSIFSSLGGAGCFCSGCC